MVGTNDSIKYFVRIRHAIIHVRIDDWQQITLYQPAPRANKLQCTGAPIPRNAACFMPLDAI